MYRVPVWCPRLLINRELVGCEGRSGLLASLADLPGIEALFRMLGGLQCESPDNIRDVAFLGNCDDQVLAMCDKLGWGVSKHNASFTFCLYLDCE